jgi:hypothetical protein
MNLETRELYCSPNGDRWYFARDPQGERVFVRHVANAPSGGQITEIDIGRFLSPDRNGPEHQALNRLIGSLVEVRAQSDEKECATSHPET